MLQVSPHALDLVQAALLASFWRLEALRRFLRRNGVSEAALAHLTKDRTKRQFIDWLFPQIEKSPKGVALVKRLAKSLSEQESFPDLEGWEDSENKIKQAKQKVAELREYLAREAKAAHDEKERTRLRQEAAERRAGAQSHLARLAALKQTLETGLMPLLGTQAGGYQFQDWFQELAGIFELPCKKPYKTPDGREVDGSLAVDGMTYLLSLKFTRCQTGPEDITDFLGRFRKVGDFTMGIVVSISGHGDGAVKAASGGGTNLLLLDHGHLYYALQDIASFGEIVVRTRQHLSRTGQAYLPITDFGR